MEQQEKDLLHLVDSVGKGSLYAWGISAIATVLAIGNVVLGNVILIWPERLTGASFVKILQFAPLGAWGWTFVVSGAVALFGQYTHRMWPTRAHVVVAVVSPHQ